MAVPDSSINVRYVMCGAMIMCGYAETGLITARYLKEGQKILDYLVPRMRTGRVRIPATVYYETKHAVDTHMRKLASRGISPRAAIRLGESAAHLISSERPMLCANDKRLLEEVKKMYDEIWTDPGYRHLWEIWARMNRRGKPAPGDGDKVILSTAAGLAGRGPVRFLVADIDFVAFKEEIERRFGIRVMPLWRPGGWRF